MLERWSSGRLLLVLAPWLLLSPILLFVLTRAMGGDLGFSVIRLLLLALLRDSVGRDGRSVSQNVAHALARQP